VPLLISTFVVTFGFASIILHFGVFVDDLQNVINILLKLTFYLSGVFYSIETRVPSPYNVMLLKLNPAAFFMSSFRNTVLLGTCPDILVLSIWTIFGLLLSYLGIKTIYKYENSYAKVI
jgi:ABC-type polysaccharide/polyol phosphate export permease